MIKQPYRFFSAFLTIAVLLATITPSTGQSKAFVREVGDLISGKQAVTMRMDNCCCSPPQKAEAAPQKKVENEKEDSCRTMIACSCCADKLPAGNEAPVPQTVSSKIATLQVLGVNLSPALSTPGPSVEQHFIKASEHSPPIFLKNCSFLN